MSIDFDKEIGNIVKNVTDLSNKKNINEIMELRNKNDEMIKNTITKLKEIKSKFEMDDIKIMQNMTDEKYEKVSSKISDNEIAKIQNIADLEEKIDEYKNLAMKIKSCIHFLENKKINIINCDNNDQPVKSDSDADELVEKPAKSVTQNKKKLVSSDSDNDDVKPKSKSKVNTKTKSNTKKTNKNNTDSSGSN